MSLTGWWDCDEVMGLLEPQAVLSWQGWVDGPSSSKKCLLDKLRCEQLSSDHQDGMRGRVECHQHSSDMKSHVSELQGGKCLKEHARVRQIFYFVVIECLFSSGDISREGREEWPKHIKISRIFWFAPHPFWGSINNYKMDFKSDWMWLKGAVDTQR